MSSVSLGTALRRSALWLTALAFALRLLVPAGSMPSSVADGWYLSLCPDGLPPAALAALLGEPEATHHHHGHRDGSGDEGGGDTAMALPADCELGSAFAAALAPGALPTLALPHRTGASWTRPATAPPAASSPSPYQPRGPPALSA
jgi:hypothetical protein